MSRGSLGKYKWVIRIVISAILLAFFLHRCDLTKVLVIIDRIPLISIIGLLILSGVGLLFMTIKWYIILRKTFPLLRLFKINIISLFYALFLPGQLGGEVMKVVLLMRLQPGSRKSILFSVVNDRMTGLLILTGLGFAGTLPSNSDAPTMVRLWWSGLALWLYFSSYRL
jgi:hypothetical protein